MVSPIDKGKTEKSKRPPTPKAIWPIKGDYRIKIYKKYGKFSLEVLEKNKVIWEKKEKKNPLNIAQRKNGIAQILFDLEVYSKKKKAKKDLTKAFKELKLKLDPQVKKFNKWFRKKKAKGKQKKKKNFNFDYNVEPISIEEVKETIEENFPQMWKPTEACLSVINTILLKDLSDPMSINLIGAPSSEKTTVLGFLYGLDGIVFKTDSFSPKSFVSHANFKEEELEEVDLLPKMKNKCFIIPELAPIFGKRKEDLIENLSIITRIFDGEGYESDSGIHGHRGYRGEYIFTWLGASTPLSNSIWRTMGKLGNRFLFFDIPPKNKSLEDLKEVINSEKPYKEKKEKCRKVIHRFVKDIFDKYNKPFSIEWEKERDDPKAYDMIIYLAKLLTKLRTTIDIFEKRDDEGNVHYSYQIPLKEEPERAINMLYNIARGRAIIYGRNHITLEDILLIYKIAISSCPYDRAQVIKIFFDKKINKITAGRVSELLNCSKRHAERIMKQFQILDIINIRKEEREEQGRPKNIYELNPETKELLKEMKQLYEKLKKNKIIIERVGCQNNGEKEGKKGHLRHKNDTAPQKIEENEEKNTK